MDFSFIYELIAGIKEVVAMFTKFISGLKDKEIVFDKDAADAAFNK